MVVPAPGRRGVLRALACGVLMVAIAMVGNLAARAESGPWSLRDDATAKIQAFVRDSIFVQDMRTYGIGNWMVYGGSSEYRVPTLTVDQLLACFQITNPDSRIESDAGGGLDIDIEQVQFAKGKWDVILRLSEAVDDGDGTEAPKHQFLIDTVRVGALDFADEHQKLAVVRSMAKGCLADPTP